ncbi:hypothetical protein [Paracoccus sp. IB05]|uniref:hypothetical protein n=1 Tax=Paracoccus sp. IB05 TaxID=2779367 RepID=UPI0018E76B79|nr:hypothetical protein [Paracoccus sp. IB05]MBJ2153389.1 hypothetical protein [Paracoccus sp. IB05]
MTTRRQIISGFSGKGAAVLGVLVLAACTPSVPDSGSGVGFQDYNSYIRNTNSGAGQTAAPAAAAPAAMAPAGTGFDPTAAAAAIDRADGSTPTAPVSAITPNTNYVAPASTGAARPRGNAPAGIKEESGELIHSNPTISDENDFTAVAARESIASDAERIARNRAEYVVVQPGALPVRPGESGPNIVEFALATTHAPGVQMYNRSRSSKDPMVACAKYTSPDLAQQDFLARGGPDKDRQGLDPDGDGFACGWDPRPFRTALQ